PARLQPDRRVRWPQVRPRPQQPAAASTAQAGRRLGNRDLRRCVDGTDLLYETGTGERITGLSSPCCNNKPRLARGVLLYASKKCPGSVFPGCQCGEALQRIGQWLVLDRAGCLLENVCRASRQDGSRLGASGFAGL